jgi:putative flippase GtrA
MTADIPLRVRFGRFGLVGILGAALQVGLFDVLVAGLGMNGVAASLIAVEIAVLHNFLWHERFTWRDRAAQVRQKILRLWRFHASNGFVSVAGNSLLMYFLVQRLKAPAVPAAIAAIAVCAPANFLLADRWIYVRRAGPSTLEPPMVASSSPTSDVVL